MKKFFYLLFSVFILSCSSEDEVSMSKDSGDPLQNTEDQLKTAGDKEYDILGYGYDITEAYVSPNSVKYQVINVKNLIETEKSSNKIYFDKPISSYISTRSYGGENFISLVESTITKTGFKGTVASNDFGATKIKEWAFSASVNYNKEYETKYSYSSKFSYAIADVYKEHRKFILEAIDFSIYTKYLHGYFAEKINNMTTPAQADLIVKDYGTHVMLKLTIGGYFRSYYKTVITEETDYTRKKEVAEAGAKINLEKVTPGVDVSWSSESMRETNTKNSSWDCTIVCVGGNRNGLTINTSQTQGSSTSISLDNWSNSVDDSSSRLVDLDWSGVYPIYEFISDPSKKQLLKDAVLGYKI